VVSAFALVTFLQMDLYPQQYAKDSKEYYSRRLGPGEKHGDCICDYHNLIELCEERQGPHRFVCLPNR